MAIPPLLSGNGQAALAAGVFTGGWRDVLWKPAAIAKTANGAACGIETVATTAVGAHRHIALAEEATIGPAKLRSAVESAAVTPQRGRHMNFVHGVSLAL
jgi:hypothetical protein